MRGIRCLVPYGRTYDPRGALLPAEIEAIENEGWSDGGETPTAVVEPAVARAPAMLGTGTPEENVLGARS